jgi:hypothetical protein
MGEKMSECKDSLKGCLVFNSRDWANNKRDAWLYGIIVGWDEESFAELKLKHRWPDEQISRLKRLRAEFINLGEVDQNTLPEKPSTNGLTYYCPECGNSEFIIGINVPGNQERICTDCDQTWFPDVDYTDAIRLNLKERIALKTELKKPMPDPVMYIGELAFNELKKGWCGDVYCSNYEIGSNDVPLYADPPARRDLTDDEIMQIFEDGMRDESFVSRGRVLNFARAIIVRSDGTKE